MSSFKPATRERLKLRLALDGPSGSGKSVTSLRLAMALAAGGKVAVIDTESGSACKYVGEDFGEGPITFDVVELSSHSPDQYTHAIDDAGKAGYAVLVIDSLSHAWEGKDGALEMKDRAASKGGNSFTAWKDITPMHRRMVEAILHSRCHVICTMRSKTEYVLEKNDRGRDVPRKVGTAPVQRPGMEYEFDIYGSLDLSHVLTVTKSRCRAVDNLIVANPGAEFAAPIRAWLETGVAPPPMQHQPEQPRQQRQDPAHPPAKPAGAPAKAAPANGTELLGRLQVYEHGLVEEGLCESGDLIRHVLQAGTKAGWSNMMAGWGTEAVKLAPDAVRGFEADRRAERARARADLQARIDDATPDQLEALEAEVAQNEKALGRDGTVEAVRAIREKRSLTEAKGKTKAKKAG